MVKKNKILKRVVLATFLIFGGALVIDVTTKSARPLLKSILKETAKKAAKEFAEETGITEAVKKVKEKTVGTVQKAKQAYAVLKGLAKSFVLMVSEFNKKLITLSYYDEVISVEVPLDLGTEEAQTEEEGESSGGSVRKIGLDYDFGFIGSGNIDEEIKAVEALFIYTAPVKIGDKEMPIYAAKFLESINDLLEKYRLVLKYLVVLPVHVVIGSMQQMLRFVKLLTYLPPESVFKFKVLSLLNSARMGKDNVLWSDIPVHLTTLLGRLANSVNETASAKLPENKGIKDPQNWKKKLYFRDTGISSMLESKEMGVVFTPVKATFEASKFSELPAWMKTEWLERKKKKKPTELAISYSNMRRLKGSLTQSAYFLEEFLPLLDKELDKTDQALFVKALIVLTARRYKGLMSVLGIPILAPLPKGGTNLVIEKDLSDVEMNNLAIVKALIEERWKALQDVLEGSLKKVKAKGYFNQNHVKKIATLLATIKGEREEFDKILKGVTWKAELPEGKTLDDIGVGENSISLVSKDMLPQETYDDPFLSMFKAESEARTARGTLEAPVVKEIGEEGEEEFGEESEE